MRVRYPSPTPVDGSMKEDEPEAKPKEDETPSNESEEDDELSRWESEGGSMARQVPDEITEAMQGG